MSRAVQSWSYEMAKDIELMHGSEETEAWFAGCFISCEEIVTGDLVNLKNRDRRSGETTEIFGTVVEIITPRIVKIFANYKIFTVFDENTTAHRYMIKI